MQTQVRTCSTAGCGKPHRARGLCATHYNQQQPNRHQARILACCVCGAACSKGRDRQRVVCSYSCRWFLQNEQHASPVWFIECQWCDQLFSSRDEHALWCSAACRGQDQRVNWPACRVFVPSCAVCDKPFVTRYTRATCSPSCAEVKRRDDKREGRHRYRARKRQAFVAPVSPRAIFHRDRWCCHLCGKAIRQRDVVPAPLAPVLDHVVPLAQGGTHEPANVRAAHYLCNSIKSDGFMPDGEQSAA